MLYPYHWLFQWCKFKSCRSHDIWSLYDYLICYQNEDFLIDLSDRSPKLRWLLSLEWLICCGDAVQSIVNTCLFGVRSTPNATSLKYRCVVKLRNQMTPTYHNCANCVSSHWTRNNSTLYLSDLQRESSTADPTADVPAADNFNSQGTPKFNETPIIKNIRLWPDDSLCNRWQTTCSLEDDVILDDAFRRAAWSTFF